KEEGITDECSRLLEGSTMKSRRGFAIQRLMNAMRQAHADGWFIVFDTLTLADDRLEASYDNPNASRDYFRAMGRMVLAAVGRRGRPLVRPVRLAGRPRSAGDGRDDRGRPRTAGRLLPPGAVPAPLSALLAVRDAPAVARRGRVVHRHGPRLRAGARDVVEGAG